MDRISMRLAAIFALALPLLSVAGPDTDDPLVWLAWMADASHLLDYDGTFVYRSDGRMQSLRILHSALPEGERERLVSLTGPHREVVRDGDRVACIMPERERAIIRKSAPNRALPLTLPSDIPTLEQYYDISLGGTERVAARTARKIEIRPSDRLRYGRNYWIDENSGLLLHAELLDSSGRAIEELLFTDLEIVDRLPAELLEPQHHGERLEWQRIPVGESASVNDGRWRVAELPPGFDKTLHLHSRQATGEVEHMMFSDGLASLSVFIEPAADGDNYVGSSRRGAMNAEISRAGPYRVTVIGEVPAETLQQVAARVEPIDNENSDND